MIISASRRTDIPAYYGGWFLQRVQAGHVLVRNPMNLHQVGKISLSPDVVDGIVFWTKNPLPFMDRLHQLRQYPYYFQFTLNAYGSDVEPNVPSKHDILVPAFQRLSQMIGKERVVWRYDPIFLAGRYTAAYHYDYFARLTEALHAYTGQCIVSFLDEYRNTSRNMRLLEVRNSSEEEQWRLLERFAKIAAAYGLPLHTCAEAGDFTALGIKPACCVDKKRLERIGGFPLDIRKDQNQRPACGCAASIDIGLYDTCPNGCFYCYANHSGKTVQTNIARYKIDSPLLCGSLGQGDVVKERLVTSCKSRQLRLFQE